MAKEKSISKALSPREKAYIRLKCLTLVVESGSRVDLANPQNKAKEYFDFVLGKRKVSVQKVTELRPVVKEPKQETVISQPVPFSEGGREKVLI